MTDYWDKPKVKGIENLVFVNLIGIPARFYLDNKTYT